MNIERYHLKYNEQIVACQIFLFKMKIGKGHWIVGKSRISIVTLCRNRDYNYKETSQFSLKIEVSDQAGCLTLGWINAARHNEFL